MNSNPFLSKEISFKRILKGFAITLPCMIMIFVIGNYSYNFIDSTLRSHYVGEKVLGVEDTESRVIGVEEIKKHLKSLIPEKYELVESPPEGSDSEDDGCINLFGIYPKTYSEAQRKYLSEAGLMYCEDIYKAVFRSQMEDAKYSQEKNAWAWIDIGDPEGNVGGYYEQTFYGNNLVSIADAWGSHYDGNLYIVRIKNSKELVVLSIPLSNRIRCETYDENGVETMKEDCVNFMNSMDMTTDWVPQEIYDNYYNDLLEMLRGI
ncbi:MAG: hypothetical protein PHE21_00305 [Candidatus Dojkabacteria bacterium]|nr:hypothetical protein [Candidatus Dojkabacteria bacterium]